MDSVYQNVFKSLVNSTIDLVLKDFVVFVAVMLDLALIEKLISVWGYRKYLFFFSSFVCRFYFLFVLLVFLQHMHSFAFVVF